MSVITAEVKVDETDVVNVKMNQPVDVTVDALPGRVFKGHVTEVGDQALLRTTGIATSQSTTGTEEAKDFKVVVTLDQVSGQNNEDLRPGLSSHGQDPHGGSQRRGSMLPLAALVSRDAAAREAVLANEPREGRRYVAAGSLSRPVTLQRMRPGRRVSTFVRTEGGKLRAFFSPVRTGITGTTEIQVT